MLLVITIIAVVFAAGIFLAWVFLPYWYCRPIRNLQIRDLGLHVARDDARVIEDWAHAINQGIEFRLRRPRRRWLQRCDGVSARSRQQVLEGAAVGAGAARAIFHPRGLGLPRVLIKDRPHHAYATCFGIGLWGALRFNNSFEDLLCSIQAYEPWWRFACVDGYGFKFGLLDYFRDHGSVAHLHAIPGYYRRAAFQGVGRAFYFGFLSDRRGFIEATAELAPQHDCDVIEGAAFAAAYCQTDARLALRFVRAMPYEWRASAHLGMTLGFRATALAEPEQFARSIDGLPRIHQDTIHHAIAIASESEEEIRREHRAGAYGLWREKVARRMHRDNLWEPVYVDAPQERLEA